MSRSQHKATNLTVLGAASLSTTLPVVGTVLVLLFVLMKPEATAGYALPERLAFWSAHIGLGLVSILVASKLIRPRLVHHTPAWLTILLTGLVGAAMLAPLYLLLEGLAPPRLADAPDDWLDFFAMQGPIQSVIAEFLEVTPVFLAAWFAVNLPLLVGRPEFAENPSDGPGGPGGASGEKPIQRQSPEIEDAGGDFYSRLPLAVGRDIILISSDMHYLHVYTTLGKCMILGTMRDAAEQLGDNGMLVHRSHWVAHKHVNRLARRRRSWECVMSNGQRVPVSRRNQSKVAKWYGRSGNVVSLTQNPPTTARRRG
jgi:hypothetical protein